MTEFFEKLDNKLKKQYDTNVSAFLRYTSVIIIIIALAGVFFIVRYKTLKTIDERVCTELESTAWLQASTLRSEIEEQYDPLRTVTSMMDNGDTFASEQMQPVLRAIMQTHEIRMFGFADLNGDVINYKGENNINISDRAYFNNIVNGNAKRQCEYLQSSKLTNEPRMIFAMPYYDADKELKGVLFLGKEINILSRVLFEDDDVFGFASSYFICDSEGMVIASSGEMYKSDLIPDTAHSIYETLPALKDIDIKGDECRQIEANGKNFYISISSLKVNDWMVGCLVDSYVASVVCADSINVIRQMTFDIYGILLIVVIYLFIVYIYSSVHKRSEMRVIRQYNENFKNLLSEINCTIAEFDIENSSLELIDDSCNLFDFDRLKVEGDLSKEVFEKYKAEHPEFDFNELKKEVELAVIKKEPQAFESIFIGSNNETHWIKVLLIPMLSETKLIKVLAATFDVTAMHKELETLTTTFTQVPGGIHRCYLSNPIHLEYYSEGLCRMVGYSHDEIAELVGPDMNYCMLIHPDDREAFANFCFSIAKNGGRQTIEYRMLCKDGSVIPVSDTMDAKVSSSGIMYGYSVVTDLQKYKEMQEKLENELAETKRYLEDLKLKNFTSQMQPHFLYNALASIREIVLDEPEYASELICDFTTYLRTCLKSVTSDALIPFSQELDNIEAYVSIEKMRFGDRLNIKYECEDTDFLIIPLSVQPLVENAIRHGIYERGEDGGTVIVRTVRRKGSVDIIVADDGVGFDYDAVMQEIKDGTRDSTGMFNLKYRFEKILKAKVKVESELNKGTRVTVSIPIGGGEDTYEDNSGR